MILLKVLFNQEYSLEEPHISIILYSLFTHTARYLCALSAGQLDLCWSFFLKAQVLQTCQLTRRQSHATQHTQMYTETPTLGKKSTQP